MRFFYSRAKYYYKNTRTIFFFLSLRTERVSVKCFIKQFYKVNDLSVASDLCDYLTFKSSPTCTTPKFQIQIPELFLPASHNLYSSTIKPPHRHILVCTQFLHSQEPSKALSALELGKYLPKVLKYTSISTSATTSKYIFKVFIRTKQQILLLKYQK